MKKLQVRGVSKSFPRKKVLVDINLEFECGKIYALYGENGAGKSTLSSIIAGKKSADSGQIISDGKISLVNQHPSVHPELTVYDHCALAFPFHKNSDLKNKIQSIFDDWNFSLNLKTKGKNLSASQRFYLELLTSLLRNPVFLILDEPTVFLDLDQRNSLYDCMKANCSKTENELCIILISHFTDEIFTFSDSVIFLKKGILQSANASKEDIIPSVKHINSEDVEKKNFCKRDFSKSLLCLDGVNSNDKFYPKLFDISFSVNQGQIVLINGQREAGLETLEEILSGIKKIKYEGKVSLSFCKNYSIRELRKNGIGLVPSNRIFRGSNPLLTVREFLFPLKEKDCLDIIRSAGIDVRLDDEISSFSGGMIQRIILERELFYKCRMYLLFEPDQGLDSRGRDLLAQRIKAENEKGASFLILSSSGEDELKTLSDKIYKLEGGVLKNEKVC
ncbi:MAG: ATP-binding cassette domain-containing protein [Treponemataceae bacterium]|nr:ATP-binding cassette domain-containing protein [Treponemataceae bacterium]